MQTSIAMHQKAHPLSPIATFLRAVLHPIALLWRYRIDSRPGMESSFGKEAGMRQAVSELSLPDAVKARLEAVCAQMCLSSEADINYVTEWTKLRHFFGGRLVALRSTDSGLEVVAHAHPGEDLASMLEESNQLTDEEKRSVSIDFIPPELGHGDERTYASITTPFVGGEF